jgi:hypothetical protein
MQQPHMHLLCFATTFAVIAMRAGRYDVCPDMLTTHMTRHHMIYGQIALAFSTVLTGIIVATKHFAARQLDVWARSMDLTFQPNDRGPGQQLFNRSDVSTPVDDHIRFARQEQADSSSRGTNIDRFKISV